MQYIVVNVGNGRRRSAGFSLSYAAWLRLRELKEGKALVEVDAAQYRPAGTHHELSLENSGWTIPRDDRDLVRVVRELGADASGAGSELRIVEIPDDVSWTIETVGGIEQISEAHRVWF
jgi:hypothetical protein